MLADLQDKLNEDEPVLEGLSTSSSQQKDGMMAVVLFYNKRDLTADRLCL
jgi:hypothetical protein